VGHRCSRCHHTFTDHVVDLIRGLTTVTNQAARGRHSRRCRLGQRLVRPLTFTDCVPYLRSRAGHPGCRAPS
jgi:hypothetical protein